MDDSIRYHWNNKNKIQIKKKEIAFSFHSVTYISTQSRIISDCILSRIYIYIYQFHNFQITISIKNLNHLLKREKKFISSIRYQTPTFDSRTKNLCKITKWKFQNGKKEETIYIYYPMM